MHHCVIWPTVRPISPWNGSDAIHWKNMVVYSGPITTPSPHTTSTLFLVVSSSTWKSSTKTSPSSKPSKLSPALGTFPTFFRKTKPLLGGAGVGDARSAAQDLEVQRRCNSSDPKKGVGETCELVCKTGWKLTNLSGFKGSFKASFLDFMLIFSGVLKPLKLGKRKRMPHWLFYRMWSGRSFRSSARGGNEFTCKAQNATIHTHQNMLNFNYFKCITQIIYR